MEYLYHRVPKHMTGTVLYPLNTLKQLHPEAYEEHVKKYEGREHLLTAEVPPLKCLWNDVLHLTAVEPHTLKANLAAAGIELPPRSRAWFKIPASLVEGENSIAFTYMRSTENNPNFKDYEKFDSARMDAYRIVPENTIKYYKQKKADGVRPFLFHGVSHILYKGSIDTTGLEIIRP